MHVVAVSNHLDPEAGHVGEYLVDSGATMHTIWRDEFAVSSHLESTADLLLLLGSDWSVYDPSWNRQVEAEKDLVRRAHDRGLPVLAICYGAQLVASALGATVGPASKPEIGWMSVTTDDAVSCPKGPWFQFHRDRWFELTGVSDIARSSLAPQAFSRGRTLALQFHPEAQPKTIVRWMQQAPDLLTEAGVDFDVIAAESFACEVEARHRCRSLVEYFLSDIAQR